MSEREKNKPWGETAGVLRCDEWENLLADAVDGTLNAADAAAFNRHHCECALCAQMLQETEQGRAWLQYMDVKPEDHTHLLQKNLALTTTGAHTGSQAHAPPQPSP